MSSDEERGETVGQLKIPAKLLETAGTAGFKDRTKRRLSLPISGAARDTRRGSLNSNNSEADKSGGTYVHTRT